MTLYTPGPVQLSESVMHAMAQPPLYHRSAEFLELSARLWRGLRYAFVTEHPVVVLAGSGMTGIEAAMSSTLTSGDEVIVVVHGRFGARLVEIAHLRHVHPTVVEVPWGEVVDVEQIIQAFKQTPTARAVWLVHGETSTGVALDVQAITAAIRQVSTNVLICLDAVTTVAVQELRCDAWDVDVVVAGSQKGLSAPPGLAMVLVGPRAQERLLHTHASTYTLDLRRMLAAQANGLFAWTPPVTLVAAMVASVERLQHDTIEATWEKRQRMSAALKHGLVDRKQRLFGAANAHGLTVVEHERADEIRRYLRTEHGMIVSGGQDRLAHRVLRIGTMGDLDMQSILQVLAAFDDIIARHNL